MRAYLFVDFNALKFKDILNNVVAIGILDKSLCMLSYLKSKLEFLFGICTVYAFLHHTATMLVAGYLLTLFDHSIVNKLIEFWFPGLQYLLNNMISVDIFCKLSDSVFQIRREKLNMLRELYDLDNLLNRSGSMSMSAKAYWV